MPSTALPAPAPAGPTGPLALPGAAGLHAGGCVGGGTSRHVRRRLGRIRQCGGGVGTGRERDLAGGHARLTEQRPDLLHLVSGGHRDDGADSARAGGPAGAVHVGLVLGRRIGMDHQPHVVDVDAARGDVGGHHDGGLSGGERVQVPHARVLGQVAVQVHAGHATTVELLGQSLGAVLGAGEHDGPLAHPGQVRECADTIVGVDAHDVVRGRSGGGGAVVDRVDHGVDEEPLDDLVHALVQGRGEQQALGAGGRGREDAGDAGQEAQVGHVVGLVQHGHLDGVHAAVLLAHEVLESAGAGHHDVDATVERGDLTALRDATEDHGGPQAHGLGQWGQRLVELAGELAGGGEDQAARGVTRAATAGGRGGREAGDQREAERVRLAGAGAAPAEDVTPGQGVGERGRLDGRGGGNAGAGEDVE